EGLEAGIRGREPVLEVLVAPQQTVLAHPVLERLADRVREQDEADSLPLQGGVAAGLVVRLDSGEPIAEPGPGRPAVELHDPEPQPAPLERELGEVAVKRFGVREPRAARPARAVELEQEVEILSQAAA